MQLHGNKQPQAAEANAAAHADDRHANGTPSSESSPFTELNKVDNTLISISKMSVSTVSRIEGSTNKALLVPSCSSVDECCSVSPAAPLERTMSNSVQRLGVETTNHEQLCQLLDGNLDKWGMNMFEVAKLSGNRPITVMLYTIFEVRTSFTSSPYSPTTLAYYANLLLEFVRLLLIFSRFSVFVSDCSDVVS